MTYWKLDVLTKIEEVRTESKWGLETVTPPPLTQTDFAPFGKLPF
jgi:hypothetical protein